MSDTIELHAETAGPALIIHRGGRGKADIRKDPDGDGGRILKDFSAKSWLTRLLGRYQVGREIRALRQLRGLPGIPEYHRRVGAHGLLMERMEGERITRWCARHPGQRSAMFDRLTRLVELMHRLGVAHMDLRKRDNILITSDGRPNVIDFNASLCFRPGTRVTRIFFRFFRHIDTAAIFKWKYRLAPELLTPSERKTHRRMTFLRRFWVFN
ncbi:MAG: lipopolysaccharide kinase InaA family protein [Acidobacteriota bacterium]